MKYFTRRIVFVSLWLILALAAISALAACSPENNQNNPNAVNDLQNQPSGGLATGESVDPLATGTTLPSDTQAAEPAQELETSAVPTGEPAGTPVQTEALPAATEPPAETGAAGEETDSTIRGAEILPSTGRDLVTQLSHLLDFQLVDQTGASWGMIDDYIINFCEAHILYIVLVPEPTLQLEEQGFLLIPYEAVTLQEGALDVEQQSVILNMETAQVAGASTFREKPDLSIVDWEADLQAFWSERTPLSLSSACTVPNAAGDGTETLHKIEYASNLIGMEIQSGNGEPLGSVEEAILQPESGQLFYLTARLDESLAGSELPVPIPIRALNIQRPEAEGETAAHLVLLVERDILENAPVFETTESDIGDWRSEADNYWSQYVPLQPEGQE